MRPVDSSDRLLETFVNSLANDPRIKESQRKASEKLIADLKKHPSSEEIEKIISNSKHFFYSDFDSPFPLPKTQLIEDLKAAGLTTLAEKAMNGEYDEEGI